MKMNVRQRVAAELRAEMARQQRAQGELADAIGVSQSTVSRQLRGEAEFSATELVAAVQFLGISLTKLLGDSATEADRVGAA